MCYSPLSGWYSRSAHPRTGKPGIVFDKGLADTARPVEVPCGRCIGCRVAKRREWSMRIMHESQFHACTSFLTLTYDEEHLPDNGSLQLRDVQLWLKRLRERISPTKVRYFLVGEYGEKLARPHYHVILFGYDFPDKKHYKGDGVRRLFTSVLLSETWPHGYATIGTVTPASASYVAGYTCKKFTKGSKEDVKEYYGDKMPEFARMSRNPGIGASWIDKYASTGVFERDFVVVAMGSPVQVPKYYTQRQPDSITMRELKWKRRQALLEDKAKRAEEYGSARLLAKQTVTELNIARVAQERELSK